MKTNRIKWDPSMLDKFLLTGVNTKESAKYNYAKKEEQPEIMIKENTLVQKAAPYKNFDEKAGQKTTESNNIQLKYSYSQSYDTGRRPTMKTNHIKWDPSMLNKFLLPDYYKYYNHHAGKQEHHKQASEKSTNYQKDSDKDLAGTAGETSQEIIKAKDALQKHSYYIQYDDEDKEKQHDIQLTDVPYTKSNSSSNNHLVASDTLPDGSTIEVSLKNKQDPDKAQNNSKREDININIKFKIPLKAAKTLENLEILVKENKNNNNK